MAVLKPRIIHLKTPYYTPCAIDLSATGRAAYRLEMFGDYMYLVDGSFQFQTSDNLEVDSEVTFNVVAKLEK